MGRGRPPRQHGRRRKLVPEPPGHQSFRATAPLLYPKALGRLAPEEAAPPRPVPAPCLARAWLRAPAQSVRSSCRGRAAGSPRDPGRWPGHSAGSLRRNQMAGPASLWGPAGSGLLGVGGQFCSLLGGPRSWPPNSIPRMALCGLSAVLTPGWGVSQGQGHVPPLQFLFGTEMRYVLS